MSNKQNDELAEQRRERLNEKYGDRAWLICTYHLSGGHVSLPNPILKWF